MNILSEILGSGNQQTISNIARQMGMSEQEAQRGLAGVLPSLMKGMKNNVSTADGERALLDAIERGDHSRYLDNNFEYSDQAAVDDGNGILGHLLGGKDRSREVATQASEATGLSSGLLKKLLPIAATVLMGTLGRKQSGGLLGSLLGGGQAKKSSGLMGLLDFDNDGSIADDVFKLAMKFF
ncbi:MAG: DUF937 domain-containing protein [Pseudomonadota bacterium]